MTASVRRSLGEKAVSREPAGSGAASGIASSSAEPVAVAIDLGQTKILAGHVDCLGTVTRQRIRPTVIDDRERLLDCLESLCSELIDEATVAVGIGTAGRIDCVTGKLDWCGRLPLTGLDLAAYLSSKLGVKVGIENDGGAAAIAEHTFGVGRGVDNMILVAVGTGIGGGLILNNRLFRGTAGYAGELGHMVIDHDGPLCVDGCSGVGHLECLASGTCLDRLVKSAVRSRPDGDLGRAVAAGESAAGPLAVALARAGSREAALVIEKVAEMLGVGLVTLVNLLNPEMIVISGGVADAGEFLLGPVRRVVERQAIPAAAAAVRIVQGELGPKACLVGAGLTGLRAAGAVI